MRRRSATVRLAAILVVVLAAAVYFLRINPIYNAIHKGLDLQGGFELVYAVSSGPGQTLTPTTLQQTLQVIRYRVNKLGVSEPVVQLDAKNNRILVELAGVKNISQAESVIGKTANLVFCSGTGPCTGSGAKAGSALVVTGAELKSASAATQQPNNQPVVDLTFNGAGAKAFATFTAANQGKTMSIWVDGVAVEPASTIQPGCCPNGQAVLQGGFSAFADAQNLAVELNSGALPLTLTVIQNQTVSATLGQVSVTKSETAAAVALALVAGFMFLAYRVPGFWADIALLVYALLLMFVLAGIRATLTLPGITGLILSIGMAVDSNVIIYERIREELRAGRSLRTSVDEGFRHGIRAVVDSNATTIIAAIVLYYLGSGLIRGFAVTVGIGVVISLLTAVVFTRYLLRWLVDAGSRPSWWFFAPRAELAADAGGLGIHAAAAAPAPVAPRRPVPGARRTRFGNLRRDWTPDLPDRAGAAVQAAEPTPPADAPVRVPAPILEAPSPPIVEAPSPPAPPAAEPPAPEDGRKKRYQNRVRSGRRKARSGRQRRGGR